VSATVGHGGGEASGRATGKVILLGEHAVVWGAPALVAGVERGLQATARPVAAQSAGALRLLGRSHVADATGDDRVGRAWAALLGPEGLAAGLEAELSGDLPAGVGLGFSAAAGVALARAVERCLGGDAADRAVERRAMAWEAVFHGNPSGIDVAAALHGGLLRFSRSEPLRRLDAPRPIELCIGLTGGASATHEMVARVAAVRQGDRARFDQALHRLSGLVLEAQQAIAQADGVALGARMTQAQGELARLNVSSAEIETLCEGARAAGALGAKLTGAGGGGAVIALLGFAATAERAAEGAGTLGQRILDAWAARGFAGFAARVGGSPEAGARGCGTGGTEG
jgi:mevalonate kinase